MHIAEQLLHSTIFIKASKKKGITTGTGFFFNFLDKENKSIPAIVTNKHVVKDTITGTLRFSIRNSENEDVISHHEDFIINNFEKSWIMHPDENIDLCILPIAEIIENARKRNVHLLYTYLTKELIPSKEELENEISRIEDVTVIGYPNGIWDDKNNLPITRRGINATPMQVDFQDRPVFLIDVAIYGGSSGSPVFIFNQGSYPRLNGNVALETRLKLVGIVFRVFNHTATGEIKSVDIPVASKQIAQTSIPNNLGIVIHARKLLDFEEILKAKL